MRIKRGTTRQRRHKKVLKLTKGFRLSYGALYKRSKEALLHAGQYSYGHRRQRRSQMKTSWLKVINAALTEYDLSYSKFKQMLSKSDVQLNSKVLAQMAVERPEDFGKLVEKVK